LLHVNRGWNDPLLDRHRGALEDRRDRAGLAQRGLDGMHGHCEGAPGRGPPPEHGSMSRWRGSPEMSPTSMPASMSAARGVRTMGARGGSPPRGGRCRGRAALGRHRQEGRHELGLVHRTGRVGDRDGSSRAPAPRTSAQELQPLARVTIGRRRRHGFFVRRFFVSCEGMRFGHAKLGEIMLESND
jgi:hypothetical protein